MLAVVQVLNAFPGNGWVGADGENAEALCLGGAVISVYVGIPGILKAKHFRLCRQSSATTS